MSSGTNLTNSAQQLLTLIVERELIDGEKPSISLAEQDPDGEAPFGNSEIMARYLSTMLEERGSHLRVGPLESYYFDVRPYSGLTGKMSFLALVDPQTNTRKLFTLGPFKLAITWWPEQNSGPTFEKARVFHLGARRQRVLRDAVPAAMLIFLEPFQQMVRIYVESRELTADEAYDLKAVTKYKSWEKMELDDLIYIALALGTTLEEIVVS